MVYTNVMNHLQLGVYHGNSKSNQSDDYQNEQPENGSENSENPVTAGSARKC